MSSASEGTLGPNRHGPDPKALACGASTQGVGGSAGGYTPPMPPGWYQDPSGRHEMRYWGGRGWTSGVSDAGQTFEDLLI
jgi:hypothetical protein